MGINKNKSKYGRHSITQHWIRNSLGVVIVILLIVEVLLVLVVRNYYYSSARQYVTSKMNVVTGAVMKNSDDASVNYNSEIRSVVESYEDKDKIELIEVARGFYECGFTLMGTGRTCDVMVAAGLPAEKVCKINEGRPNILDKITNGEVAIIINTPNDKKGRGDDSYIRKAAVKAKIPYFTNMAAAKATVQALRSIKKNGHLEVKSLQEFHSEIQ